MPTYTFRCNECEQTKDYILPISRCDDPEGYDCPSCGQKGLKRFYGEANYAFMSPESLGRKKAPSDFRQWLSAVGKANKGSYIRDH